MIRAISTNRHSLADNPRVAPLKPTARSRLTNGTRLFAGADGRTRQARRMRDLLRAFLDQTGGRFEQACRSLASLCVVREELDAALARGEPVDSGELIRVCGAVSRLMTKLDLITADDEPAYDATDEVIRHIRAQNEAAA